MDAENQWHSFNDEPAATYVDAKHWYYHGMRHRDGDKPASVYFDKDQIISFTYYFHGLIHRGNDKPALIAERSQSWCIMGSPHRINGPSAVFQNNTANKLAANKWALYDLVISEKQHSEIISYSFSTGAPVWISFLYYLNAFSDSDIKMLKEATSNWKATLPVNWVLAATGVTPKKLEQAYNSPKIASPYGYSSPYEDNCELIQRLTTIINYENQA